MSNLETAGEKRAGKKVPPSSDPGRNCWRQKENQRTVQENRLRLITVCAEKFVENCRMLARREDLVMGWPWAEMTGGGWKRKALVLTGRTGLETQSNGVGSIRFYVIWKLAPISLRCSRKFRMASVYDRTPKNEFGRVSHFPRMEFAKVDSIFFRNRYRRHGSLCDSGRRTLKMKNASSRTKNPGGR